jgi:predicted DsbA family dithiol-disulfide isomerase
MNARKVLQIDIVSDLVSPWCYLGMRRMDQALARLSGASTPEINWRPFQINPDIPTDGVDVNRYLTSVFGSPEAGRAALRDVATAAESDGIRFDFGRVPRVPNTMDAHRVILMAAEDGRAREVAQRLFRGFFEEGMDIGRTEVLAELGGDAGMDGEMVKDCLASDRYRSAVRVTESTARSAGLTGVPSFVINKRLAVTGVHEPEMLLSVVEKALFPDLPDSPTPDQLH